jgi:hypothetical protein
MGGAGSAKTAGASASVKTTRRNAAAMRGGNAGESRDAHRIMQ